MSALNDEYDDYERQISHLRNGHKTLQQSQLQPWVRKKTKNPETTAKDNKINYDYQFQDQSIVKFLSNVRAKRKISWKKQDDTDLVMNQNQKIRSSPQRQIQNKQAQCNKKLVKTDKIESLPSLDTGHQIKENRVEQNQLRQLTKKTASTTKNKKLFVSTYYQCFDNYEKSARNFYTVSPDTTFKNKNQLQKILKMKEKLRKRNYQQVQKIKQITILPTNSHSKQERSRKQSFESAFADMNKKYSMRKTDNWQFPRSRTLKADQQKKLYSTFYKPSVLPNQLQLPINVNKKVSNIKSFSVKSMNYV